MPVPKSTYRLQITSAFTLNDAAAEASYIHDLGADWLYLSPLLRAEAGSDHGYDVVDHSEIDPARGGAAGLSAAVAAARRLGLGVLIDIVPNHVGVATPTISGWWWDLLKNGQASAYASYFDVDWAFGGGKVRIPVLGSAPVAGEEIEGLEVVGDELHYYDNVYPIAPGSYTEGDSATTVLQRQHYELMDWRRADDALNYRRFFAVNSLAGIRVEEQVVFDDSHVEIARWFREGLADGLRVDHPDGLRDPGTYLDRLSALTGQGYVLVEKILEGREQMPSSWPTAGTTGYDALADFDRVLVDPAGQAALDALDQALATDDRPAPETFENLIHTTKRGIADGILRSEVLRLQRDLAASGALDTAGALSGGAGGPGASGPGASGVDAMDDDVADAIAELLTCFPVYRSYLPLGLDQLEAAATLAREHRPDLAGTIDAILPALGDPDNEAAKRFQQTSGMVMAKGVEDTAFYRYNRLTSLNEVGADPGEFAVAVPEFHKRQVARLRSYPNAMTTLSTHDTKRGEDTRARISVISELTAEWASTLSQLRALAPLGDGQLENLLWQAIVGSWPASRERLHAYAEKASREAGDSTGWLDVNETFEERMHALIDSAFDDPEVGSVLAAFLARVEQPGWSNSLSLKLLQLTAPGSPDVYQGSELWETSLVDPDNRRPVDYTKRRVLLSSIDGGFRPAIDASGAAKLLVTSRALRLKRDRPGLFQGYRPLTASGSAAGHVVAFDRDTAVTVATRLPVGLAAAGGWGDTSLDLDSARVVDVITGRSFSGDNLLLSELLSEYPVALLAPATEA
ncbi:malto-oligosyltrehalose synthase [Subtercola boreus]|uniref:Malto-oligosyltrehalose synthase n=1 Tax=Subtercola boreus TaxID=120213 RepID=A0A3E0WE01_9MICO|nr:malto-oligosyltrehalose synthase [Subtercola boreus]RFA22087.1 malto-oligosyltrehalose synthase [Subtercola boreus]RFA22267.1 malto-oligosyltrehalose synthase [Subtercola boreus]RFA28130.1 malto-oligosyltrehalose synthase [Subtercola boreus]